MTYTPPAVTDCTGGPSLLGGTPGGTVELATRVYPVDEIRTVETPPAPARPFTGPAPGPFGGECRCVELANPPASLDSASGAGKSFGDGPLGVQARLSPERSVWVVCSYGALWAAVVTHQPFGMGPWHKLVDLPASPGGCAQRVMAPSLAALSPTRIAVGWWVLVDNGGSGSSWPVVDYGQPFDVVGDSFSSAGPVEVFSPSVNYVPQGRLETLDTGMAVGIPWPTPNQEGSLSIFGVVSLNSDGTPRLHSTGLATGTNGELGQPSWLAADADSGNHLFTTVETVGAFSGGHWPVSVVGYLMTRVGSNVQFSHRTVLYGPLSLAYGGMFDYTDPSLVTLIAPACRIGRGRYAVAVRAILPDASTQSAILLVAASASGLTVEATLAYPETSYGIKEIQAVQGVEDNHFVAFLRTDAAFASEPDPPSPDLETHHAFASVIVQPGRADITGAWAPPVRSQTAGPTTAKEYDYLGWRILAMGMASPGLATAGWNISPVLDVPGIYNTCDPVAAPAEYRMEAQLCLLTAIGGEAVTNVRDIRAVPRGATR